MNIQSVETADPPHAGSVGVIFELLSKITDRGEVSLFGGELCTSRSTAINFPDDTAFRFAEERALDTSTRFRISELFYPASDQLTFYSNTHS